MKAREDESWLDDVLIAAYDSAPQPELAPWPLRPDFDRWLRQHPEALVALQSAAKRRQRREVARGVPVRVAAWLLARPYRVAATAAALVVLVALAAWLSGGGTPPLRVTEKPAPRGLSGTDPEAAAGLDQQACSVAAKREGENEGPESSAGLIRRENQHVAKAPERRAAGLPQSASAGAIRRLPWLQVDTTPLLAGGRANTIHAGRVPLSIWLAEASAVVRARMVRITEEAVVCEVVRVIYGRVPGKTLNSANLPFAPLVRELFRHEHGREPTAAEIRTAVSQMYKFKPGEEVILTLGSCRKSKDTVVFPFLRVFGDAPGWRSLDQLEKEMVDILAAGAHMMPRCIPEAMGFYIPSCDQIVRGRLARMNDRTAEWEVVNVLFHQRPKPGASSAPGAGPGGPRKLIIGLDPWRLRAEAVVAYQAAQDSKQPRAEAAVRQEFARLIQAELPVGREAILLTRALPGSPGGSIRHKLVAIVFANPTEGQPMERLQEAVRQMIAEGPHVNL